MTNLHKDKVPAEWIRKQTLANAERYITEELKEYEQKILGADEKIQAIEERLYLELINACGEFVSLFYYAGRDYFSKNLLYNPWNTCPWRASSLHIS